MKLKLAVGAAAVAFAALLGSAPGTALTSIMVNGDFELPGLPPATVFVPNTAPAPWFIEAGNVDHVRNAWVAASGVQSIDLAGSDGRGTLRQDLATQPGTAYRLRFAMAGTPPNPFCTEIGVKTMEVRWGTTLVATLSFDATAKSVTNMGWTYHEFTVVATDPTTSLRFKDVTDANPAANCGPALDDVSAVAPSVGGIVSLLVGQSDPAPDEAGSPAQLPVWPAVAALSGVAAVLLGGLVIWRRRRA